MKRPPLSQTITSAVSLCILLGLGTWQMQRLEWKDAMIGRLEHDYAAMAERKTPLTSAARLDELAQEKEPIAIGKVRGKLQREDAILLGPKPDEGRIGYHLLVPLHLDGGSTIIVNTGWVDQLWKDDTEDRLSGLPQESITVTGVLRKADWNSFTSRNSPGNDQWFRADVAEIAREKQLGPVYPFLIYASAVNPPLHDVKPIDVHWLPRNKHLQYAIFWYSMAIVLIGVYGFYWKSRR